MMKQLLLSLLLLPFSLYAQDPSNYKIYDTGSGLEISLSEMISKIKNADVVFFGEEHNDATAHELEVGIFRLLHEQNGALQTLSLEMFETDVQQVLDEYLAGIISERNFTKEARAWNNYADYRPMVEYAKENKLYVIAANTPKRYVNLVTRKGLNGLDALNKASLKWLPPLPIDTASGRYYEKFIESLGGHNMPGMQIYQSQNLWDAGMAWSVANYLNKQKKARVFHVNGRFHSDEGLGAVAQFRKYRPRLQAFTISAFSDGGFASPDWQKFSGLADFVIITNPERKRTY